MTNFLKKLFPFRKKLTDDELLDVWDNSQKSFRDFEVLVNSLSEEKKLEAILDEMQRIELRNLNDLNHFEKLVKNVSLRMGGVIEKLSKQSGHKMKIYMKKIDDLMSNLDIYRNLLALTSERGGNIEKPNDKYIDKRFLFNNKYIILTLLGEKYNLLGNKNDQTEDLLNFIFSNYISSPNENYLQVLDYLFLHALRGLRTANNSAQASQLYKLFLPNKENINFFTPNTVKHYLNFSESFLKSKSTINTVNEEISPAVDKFELTNLNLYFNIIIHFQLTANSFSPIANLILSHLKEINQEDFTILTTLLDLYKCYKEVYSLSSPIQDKSGVKTFKAFCEFQIQRTFDKKLISNLSKISKETFCDLMDSFFKSTQMITGNIAISNTFSEIFNKQVENLPIVILNELLIRKAPIKILSSYLLYIFKFYEDKDEVKVKIKAFISKFLIENMTNSFQNNLLLFETLEINKHIFNCEDLIFDLSKHVKLINVVDKQKIQISLLELIKEDYKLTSSEAQTGVSEGENSFEKSVIHKTIMEYLQKISKNLRYPSDFKFIDSNLDSIVVIKDYLAHFQVSLHEIVVDFIKAYNFSQHAVKILLNNNYISMAITQKEFENYLATFIDSKNILKENDIDDYLEDIKNILNHSQFKSKIDKNFEHKLRNLYRYFEIKKVFHMNNLEETILSEFDFEHLNLNLNTILEIFIFKKFNVDQVESLETFVQRTQDIFKALDIDKLDYLYNLFLIFFKFQKTDIYIDIINFFANEKGKGFDYFEKSLNVIKKSIGEANYSNFINENNFKLKLLEKSDNYNLFTDETNMLDNVDFSKVSMKFNLDNEDFLTKLTLHSTKNSEEKYTPVIQNDEFFTEDMKTNFFICVQNFNEIYSTVNKNETKNVRKSALKYSLHHKLKTYLDKLNFDYKGKEFKINTNLSYKCGVYRLLIRRKLINTLEEILDMEHMDLGVVTNFSEEKKDEVFKIVKFLLNLYDESISALFEGFEKDFSEKNNEIFTSDFLNELLISNLQNSKYVSIFQLNFLERISGKYKFVFPSKSKQIPALITKTTKNKFNILPFLDLQSDYSTTSTTTTIITFKNLLENKNLSENLINSYSETTLNINYFKENLFLGSEKSKTFNKNNLQYLQTKLQLIEIYKHINMNNIFNFNKVSPLLENFKFTNLLFTLKALINLTNLLSVNPVYFPKVKEIMKIIKAFNFSEEEFKFLCYEIFNLPDVHFIVESHANILLFEKGLTTMIRDFINSKLFLFEEIFGNFSHLISKSYLVTDRYKIFKIKNCLIQHCVSGNNSENEIRTLYENLQSVNEFHKLKSFAGGNEKLKNDIEKIYTAY